MAVLAPPELGFEFRRKESRAKPYQHTGILPRQFKNQDSKYVFQEAPKAPFPPTDFRGGAANAGKCQLGHRKSKGKQRCRWCQQARKKRVSARPKAAWGGRRQGAGRRVGPRYLCGHLANVRYSFCPRKHEELVYVDGQEFRSGTHRFGVNCLWRRTERLDDRLRRTRRRYAPAEQMPLKTELLRRQNRDVIVQEKFPLTWKGQTGCDRFGVRRLKGEEYVVVGYTVVRKVSMWVLVTLAERAAKAVLSEEPAA